MALALFDLDNTLLAGDSDYLWGVFLVEKGLVDAKVYEDANERFYKQYAEGKLDILEFLNFSLKPLSVIDTETLNGLHEEFMDKHIRPIMTLIGQNKVNEHKQAGDTTMIITATNSFVTGPIAKAFGVDHLIASEPEIVDGKYTGNIAGTPSFQEGKITRLNDWMTDNKQSLMGSTFYSDSHNDLALLEVVDTPVVVDGDDTLRDVAEERNWQVVSFRR